MRVTHLLITAMLASFLLGCSGSNDTSNKNVSSDNQEIVVLEGADLGRVNLFIKPENNSFLYADWVVNSVMLLKEGGIMIPVTKGDPSEPFKLPLSGYGDTSYLLEQLQLPKGEYVGLAINIDVENSLFAYLTADGMKVPTLFNENGRRYNSEYPFETVVLSFKDEKVLQVDASPAAIHLAVDVDGSFGSLITANEDNQTTYIFSPVIDASIIDAIDEEVIVEGYLDSLNNKTMRLNAFYFGFQESLPFEVAISESTFKKDLVSLDVIDAVEWTNGLNLSDTPVYIKAKGQYKSNTLSLSSVSMVDTVKWPEKVAKIAFSDGFADITRILDENQKANPFFLMNSSDDQASIFEKMTFKGADWWLLDRENNKQAKGDPLNIQITGSIKSLSPLVVEPQALNATSNSFLGLSEFTIKGKKLSSEAEEGDLVVIDGYFESLTTVNASTISLLNDLPHRIEIRLPIITQTELAEFSDGELAFTEQGLEESIYRVFYPGSGAVFEDISTSVKSIDFSSASVIVHVGRVDPYAQLASFSTASEAAQLIKELTLDGFQINGVKADGNQEGDRFKASKLIVTVFGPSDLDLLADGAEANLSLSLKGQLSPLLKGFSIQPSEKESIKLKMKKITFATGSLKAGAGYNNTQNAESQEMHKQASSKSILKAQQDSETPSIDSRKKNLSTGSKSRLGLGKLTSHLSSQVKIWRLSDIRSNAKSGFVGISYRQTDDTVTGIKELRNNTSIIGAERTKAFNSLRVEASRVQFVEKYIAEIDKAVQKKGAFKMNSRYLNEAGEAVKDLKAALEKSQKATLSITDKISTQATLDANTKYNTVANQLNDLETKINTKSTTVSSPDSTIKRRR